MAEGADDQEVFWVDPDLRGLLPLDGFRPSRSLARSVRRGGWAVSVDVDFAGVMDGCADRDETWINPPIRAACEALHGAGLAHSVEVWRDGVLAGGVYGIALNAAFFAESMFSRARDASKVGLWALTTLLREGGFGLCDTQFLTPHLASLGGIEVPREDYRERLGRALEGSARLRPMAPRPAYEVVQRSTQTS